MAFAGAVLEEDEPVADSPCALLAAAALANCALLLVGETLFDKACSSCNIWRTRETRPADERRTASPLATDSVVTSWLHSSTETRESSPSTFTTSSLTRRKSSSRIHAFNRNSAVPFSTAASTSTAPMWESASVSEPLHMWSQRADTLSGVNSSCSRGAQSSSGASAGVEASFGPAAPPVGLTVGELFASTDAAAAAVSAAAASVAGACSSGSSSFGGCIGNNGG
mmetsp:Transcript_49980/g.116790  ORF Transcript_49980/g.116790 Transcript_49980/m.116790 type:complete len:225 (-) Transcript_49980:2343-3017(-)